MKLPAGASIVMLAVALLTAPAIARGPQAARTARVAVILPALFLEMVGAEPAYPLLRGFVRELRALNWVEGHNLILERRAAEGPFAGDIVRELVGLRCDVIVVAGSEIAREARQVTTTVPIVVWGIGNPVASGLAASLARPGGNITGFQTGVSAESYGKSLQLLKEAVPKATRVATVEYTGMWNGTVGQHQRAAAAPLGMTLLHVSPFPWERAFDEIVRQRPDAVVLVGGPFLYSSRDRIIDVMARNRLPLMTRDRDFTEAGGLMSYGTNPADYGRRIARYVDRILSGTDPGHLPIEGPSKVELVINLKTAAALGLTIPPGLRRLADQVIQ